MPISPDKRREAQARMQRLGIREEDLVEKFILGSGSGGQKINKTSSCVYLRHIPSGIEVKCQQDRSRELNRYLARRMLCDKYAEAILKEKSKKKQLQEKIRRQKRRRSRKQKEKMLQQKHLHSDVKRLRAKPQAD